MKFYGSRFCRRCGRMFSIAAPDDWLCAACQQSAEPAPVKSATVTPAQVPAAPSQAAKRASFAAPKASVNRMRRSEKGRHRPLRPKSTATGRNGGPVTGQRTLPMLRALAAAPRGLTTPQLAEYASSASTWINALGSTRQLMLKQERLGRVRQAGTAAGNRTRESVIWRITEEGERYVKEAGAGEAAHLPVLVPVRAPEPDSPPARRRQRKKAIPGDRSGDPSVPHLTGSGYKDYGCRCEECVFAHQQDMALFRARRKVTAGKPLSELEAQVLAEDVADTEGRLYYRAWPNGRVTATIIPRWVPGELCGPVSPTGRALAAAGHGPGVALMWS